MNSSAYILIIIITSLLSINQSHSQAAQCDFYFQIYSTYSSKITYYSCVLLIESSSNSNSKLTAINGHHASGFNDNDVKYIVSHANIKFQKFSSIFSQKFPNLEAILMLNAGIESVDADAVTNCKNLMYLQLIGNKIQSLPDNVFQSMLNLRELILQNNSIKSVNPKTFENMPSLTLLSLSGNDIAEVPPKAFVSLSSLESLQLNSNSINKLHPDSFEGLGNIKTLMLHANQITDLPAAVFVPLRSLTELVLWNNRLTTLNSDSFGNHPQLKNLYIAGNPIMSIDERILDKTSLLFLDMTNVICYNGIIKSRDELRVNARKCFDDYMPRNQVPNERNQKFHQKLDPRNQQSTEKPQSSTAATPTCGKSMAGQGNVIGGAFASRGEHPWNVALIDSNSGYFCGGTIVTSRKIITAAHCMQDKGIIKPKLPSMFIALVGVYNLNNPFEIGRTPYAVQNVHVHPEWNYNAENYDADIAVLVLEAEVWLSKYIQPACIAHPDTNVVAIATGVVVGYGKSEDTTKIHENIPKVLEMPIHTNEDCFLNFTSLIRLSSKRTFCAGSGHGVGVCRGDSGSGLFVVKDSTYYLRGIVSSSILNGPYGCDVNVYARR
ncbi:uncharacterized protein [Chironomus tepperi]|uniref:uncharacterized protein n=1 Tax=Chironomus tepperi TaxID=113505 RepID=UPI00391F0B9D